MLYFSIVSCPRQTLMVERLPVSDRRYKNPARGEVGGLEYPQRAVYVVVRIELQQWKSFSSSIGGAT